jgi:hypothetical protein
MKKLTFPRVKLLGVIMIILTASGCGGGDEEKLSGDLNCNDFRYQQDAQEFFNSKKGDPHNLDYDNDGIACEHLPSS